MRKALAYGTVALALVAAPAFAQSTATRPGQSPAATPSASTTSRADDAFVMKAAKGGLAEVELGKLAAEKASSSEVKNFAQRMVDDHSKANDELKSIALQKNITVPSAIDAKDKATYNRLSKMSGAAFDRAYMADMLKDHKTDVADFQYEARAGQDTEVRTFASKTLPTLQDHLKMAETTNGAVATSGMKSNGASVKPAPRTGATGTSGTNDSTASSGNGAPGAAGNNPR